MPDSRQAKLLAVAARGGTQAERDNAAARLRTLPALRPEESDDVWTGQGVLARDRKGSKAYLRGTALAYFLANTRDGVAFTCRTIHLSDDFGQGDFYTILSWLLKLGLCLKDGTRYTVPSRKAVVTAWNAACDCMKL